MVYASHKGFEDCGEHFRFRGLLCMRILGTAGSREGFEY
jgi:hypothetical protein